MPKKTVFDYFVYIQCLKLKHMCKQLIPNTTFSSNFGTDESIHCNVKRCAYVSALLVPLKCHIANNGLSN